MEDIEGGMNDRDPSTGHFLPGNKFWLARSSHGPKPKFTNPDDLWDACVEYFEWNAANPLYEAKAFAYEGCVTVEYMPLMRAMTIEGLCLFLDIDVTTWRGWRENRTDLIPVITRAETVIRKQKFEGASANLLNANIIARDLGLADKSELTGKDGSAIKVETRNQSLDDLVDEARKLGIDPEVFLK